jgi:hypothetical protein
MSNKLTMRESLDDLTGYDEQSIENRFGLPPIGSEGQESLVGLKLLRALVFANRMHDGLSEEDAFKSAMGLKSKDLSAEFSTDQEDAMPDEPDTESGKDVSADVEPLRNVPLGA